MTSLAEENPAALADLEAFLFGTVGPHFRDTGIISPEDFWLILIWKANRAKTRARKRLQGISDGTWARTVDLITNDIFQAQSDEGKLIILLDKWRFRLPTASAILSVCYPDDFSIYDIRACETLELDNFGDFSDMSDTSIKKIWEKYTQFLKAVRESGGHNATLRQKDHYLWGRSLLEGVKKDLAE